MQDIDTPVDSYEKQQRAIRDTLKKAAADSDSEILKKVAKDKEDQPEMRKKMALLSMLYHEMREMIEGGDMKFADAIDDFQKAAKAID